MGSQCLLLRIWPHGAIIHYLRQLLSILLLHHPICNHVCLQRPQREEKTMHNSGDEGSQIHHAISYSDAPSCQPTRPLICRQLLSQSSFRLMRCQKLHLWQKSRALPQTDAGSPAALTANDLSCCYVTSLTLQKGESCLSHQRELRNSVYQQWLRLWNPLFSSPAALWRKWFNWFIHVFFPVTMIKLHHVKGDKWMFWCGFCKWAAGKFFSQTKT